MMNGKRPKLQNIQSQIALTGTICIVISNPKLENGVEWEKNNWFIG